MRLTFVISSLSSGGAERVLSILANFWAQKGWAITVLTFDDGTEAPFYQIDARVQHVSLDLARTSSNSLNASFNNLSRIRVLRRAIRASEPDCVISFIDQVNVLTLLATRGLRTPVIVVEQSYPPQQTIRRVWKWLRDWQYPKAAAVVGVTARALSQLAPRIQSRASVIHNPVLHAGESSKSDIEKVLARPAMLAIGRLHQEKGHDLLLRAFAQLKDRHTAWSLVILGDGAQRCELENLACRLGIDTRVSFYGRVGAPNEFLHQADIFVLPSRYEGFPMALGEAMACGLPVVAMDCPTGPAEMIRHEVDGLLVPNGSVEALAAALDRLMSDETLRRELSGRARAVTERFSLDGIMKLWEDLLEQNRKTART